MCSKGSAKKNCCCLKLLQLGNLVKIIFNSHYRVDLTEPRRALQPKGTQWFPRIEKWKKLSRFRQKDFFVISHEDKDRFFVVIWPQKTVRHIKYWPRIDLFFSKNQNLAPKHKMPNNQWEKLSRFRYCQISKFWIFKSALLLSDLGFLTNARRDAMRSKTQWVFFRDLDWWPGPQKVQFGEITGYP